MSTNQAASNSSWRKSSYSGGQGGDCIEISESSAVIRVRDSKDKAGPQLTFSEESWAAFVGMARDMKV